jgi:hypothetical protein
MLLKVSVVVAILGVVYFYIIPASDQEDSSVQLQHSYDYIISKSMFVQSFEEIRHRNIRGNIYDVFY